MKNRIFITEWKSFKPYGIHSSSDNYYLKLTNEINKIFYKKYNIFLETYLDKNKIDLLAIFLVSYFEDIISETRIFSSFVKKHQELYGTELPFYDTSEYYEDEINIQDVKFLIWYFLNTLIDNVLIYPTQPFIHLIAEDVMQVFEREYEYAPENPVLQIVYQLPDNEKDYYKIRDFLQTIIFDTYLFKIDTDFELIQVETKILEENKDDEMLPHYINELLDTSTFSVKTKLLALSSKEWAAEILGEQHSLYNSILNISNKISGFFFYKGQDETDIFLEHIATDKKFKLTKKSFEKYDELTEIDTIIHIGMVRWQGEWWFSGFFVQMDFDANLVLDEKKSIKSRMAVNFLDEDTEEVKDIMQKYFDAFKAINNNKQIAFMPANKVEYFTNKIKEFYNNSLNLSKKEREVAIKRVKKDGFFGETNNDNFLDFDEHPEPAVVFFNTKSGIEINFEVASAFPDKDNPFYKKEDEEVELIRLFADKGISPELVNYCIDNYQNELTFLHNRLGKIFKDYTDFLSRFYKKENYYSKSHITMI